MAHDVFISYSSPDKAVAEAICAALESKRIQCWLAPRNVGVGKVWVESIVDAIDDSRIFILLLSSSSNSSPQVIREVERAASEDITIVPIRIDDTPMSKGMGFFISRHQWLNVQIPLRKQDLEELTRTIQQLLVEDKRIRTRPETEQATKEKTRLEEEAAQSDREAAERERQQAEEARKARELEEKTRQEAERLAKEKEEREAKEAAEGIRQQAEDTRKAKEAERLAKQEQQRKATEAAEHERQQAEEARKAKEAEERARKEAEQQVKEKELREAKEAAKRARQQAEEARKARETEEKARKEAERLTKEKEQREIKEATALARQQAKKVPKEVGGAQKITKSVWFWAGASLLVIGFFFMIIAPIMNIQKFPGNEEGLRAGLGVMLILGFIPTALGTCSLCRSLVTRHVSKSVWLRAGDMFFIAGVVLPFVMLMIISYGTAGKIPLWYLVVPLLLGASLAFVIPAVFCLRRGLTQELQPQVIKLTQIRGFRVRLVLLLTSLVIPIVFAVLISQNPNPTEGQTVGLGMMLISTIWIILSFYYFWRGLVKNRLSKRNYLRLADTFLVIAALLPFVLIGILLSGTPGTAPMWDLILPPVLLASLPIFVVGVYCLRQGLVKSTIWLWGGAGAIAVALIFVFVFVFQPSGTPSISPTSSPPGETAAQHYSTGLSLLEKGKYDQAIAELDKALALDPDIAVDPGYAKAYSDRGLAYSNKGSYDQAIADLTKALALDPNTKVASGYAKAYSDRGQVYSNQGQYDLALVDYTKAIELDPNNAEYYDQRGWCYRNRSFQQPTDEYALALADLTKALALDPNNTEYYDRRSAIYRETGKFDLALADNNKAIELEPNNIDHYVQRGWTYFNSGKNDLALADFNKVIELDPNNAGNYLQRGSVYMTTGENALALADFNKAIELDPNNAGNYLQRGYLYMGTGEKDLARADFEKCIALGNPKFSPLAQQALDKLGP